MLLPRDVKHGVPRHDGAEWPGEGNRPHVAVDKNRLRHRLSRQANHLFGSVESAHAKAFFNEVFRDGLTGATPHVEDGRAVVEWSDEPVEKHLLAERLGDREPVL